METTSYEILRLAAFSDGQQGGNPAGVVICDELPDPATMLAIAKDVNYSETVFACPANKDGTGWKVRYYAPEIEVPFCGHATIALTDVLAKHTGNTAFTLELKEATITTMAEIQNGAHVISLVSPPPKSTQAEPAMVSEFLDLFSLAANKLDPELPAATINAGAPHFMIALKDRHDLSAMNYDMAKGAALMKKHGVATVMFAYREAPALFHVRNAFASGGVFEDPATGAAAAAFTGYLHDISSSDVTELTLIQGEDMGMKSVIHTKLDARHDGVVVSGTVRPI